MTENKYPIEEIKGVPETMEDQGYRLWYWILEGSALNSPFEPFGKTYWKKNFNAALVYGVSFPFSDEKKNLGDLIILVSQDLEFVKESHSDEPLPAIYRSLLFQHILELGFPHTEKINDLPLMVHEDIRKRLEIAFVNYIVPKMTRDGGRYRGFNEMEEYEIQKFDEEERIKCPKCGRLIADGDGMMSVNGYRVDDDTIFINAFCVICGEPFGVRLLEPRE